MYLKELVYIKTIVESGSISNASEKLFISQSALSQYISNLEASLGVTIFNRTKTGVTLTYAGEYYYKTCKKMLSEWDNFRCKLKDLDSMEEGEIRIGMPIFRSILIVPEICPVYKKAYPKINLKLFEEQDSKLLDLIMNEEIDLSVITLPVKENDKIYLKKIISEELVLITSKEEKYKSIATEKKGFKYKHIELSELNNETFILLKSDYSSRYAIDKEFKNNKISMGDIIDTKNLLTAYRLASSNFGIAILPDSYAMQYQIISPTNIYSFGYKPIRHELAIIYKKNRYLSEASKKFIELIESFYSI